MVSTNLVALGWELLDRLRVIPGSVVWRKKINARKFQREILDADAAACCTIYLILPNFFSWNSGQSGTEQDAKQEWAKKASCVHTREEGP
jgi:hypothetical protein